MPVSGLDAEWLASELRSANFSGIVRIERGSDLIFELACGLADRANERPNRPTTRFEVASVSKLFTALTVARLVGRGLLSFESRLVEVLAPDERPRDVDPAVTLAHLLSHTSGIADYADEYEGVSYEAIWEATPSYRMRSPRDYLPLFAELPRRADAGVAVRYNNAGFVLLALAIERITSRPFIEAVADEVLAPAGMTDSGYFALDEIVPDIAIGYLAPPGQPSRTNVYSIPAVGSGDGGAFCTAADLTRLLRAFIDGDLLSPEMREEVLRPRVHDPVEDADYGYGVQMAGLGERYRIGHGGGDPGANARVAWYPASNVRLVVLSNVTNGAVEARRLAEEALFGPA